MELLHVHTPPDTSKVLMGTGEEDKEPGLSSPPALFSLRLHQAKQILAEKPEAEKSLLTALVGVTLLKGHWGRQPGIPEVSPAPGVLVGGQGLFPMGPWQPQTEGGLDILACRFWALLPPAHLLSISCLLPSTSAPSATMATSEFPREGNRWGFRAAGCQLPLVPSQRSCPCLLLPHGD